MIPWVIPMSCTFLYCRVSTSNQSTENQVQDVKNAGFDVQASRVIEETISDSVLPVSVPASRSCLSGWNQVMY